MKPLTLGTAGHIDHGKTALIRALTGVDTDRLPEERSRGISIELGYARLTLPSGRRLSVVDVPGHERFVRTMVAGATGIDLFLMTVAADDGVMPQTREHASVLRALGVHTGVVAVTKSDLSDPELALLEASELLPEAEAIAVSARTGAGLDELRAALERASARVASRADAEAPARLHVDRVFTIRGAGTVVTGTLWSGAIGRGDELAVLPAMRRARVRGVQVHDEPVDRAAAGQRVAVNLTGLSTDEIDRGDVLVSGESDVRPTYRIDAELEFVADGEPEHGERVHIHHGTREAPARLAWLGGRFWQIRLERPLVPATGDRLVVRRVAPPDTLGGGRVLDPAPRRHGPSREVMARLERLARGETPEPAGEARQRSGWGLGSHPPTPTTPGTPAKPAPNPPAEQPLPASARALEQRLRDAGFEPPLDSEHDARDLAALRDAGRAVRVSKTLHYHADVLAEIRQHVIELAGRGGGAVTLAQLRDELGTSRKFAQALLEHFDSEKLTIRRGDEHVLRRGVAPSGEPK
jgi:selenocysteine-specific elongation factor